MEAKAYLRYVRISPRKIQIVCDLIRGKDAQTAMAILMQTPKAASQPLMKLLKSACANAENNFSMDPEKLVVTQVLIPTASEWASSKTGIPVGMPAMRRSAIFWSRITRSVCT